MLTFLVLGCLIAVLPAIWLGVCGRKTIDITRMIVVAALVCAGGILWEKQAYGSTWILPESKALGIHVFGVPIEQYLFLFFAPILMISIYSILSSEGPLLFLGRDIDQKGGFIFMTLLWPVLTACAFVVRPQNLTSPATVILSTLLFLHMVEFLYFLFSFRPESRSIGRAFLFILPYGLIALNNLQRSKNEGRFSW